ncbi:isoprenylcysteine carboxylmethyltransferase family protein [Runella sp.]|uniref:isoprenylcysteine carboxylmethyltransferase family protein n=1 Tax=Runella sp. TaxID=1960881 RepID=UPI003D0C805B
MIGLTGGFAVYAGVLIFFHLSEYGLTARYNPQELSVRSLLFSVPYVIALLFSLTEFWVESYLFPEWKAENYPCYVLIGLIFVAIGETLRKVAIITAGRAFSHEIRTEKNAFHQLITTGIYKWIRHPAYLGWFIWAPATQVLLKNPVSFVLFVLVGWRYFSQRIPFEENILLSFFGERYEQYRQKTPTRIPFIP